MGSAKQHAVENMIKSDVKTLTERRQKLLLDQRNEFNKAIYNKNRKAIDIFQNKLRSDIKAQFKMRGLDPKSNDPAVRKILESIVGRAKSKNDKYMRSLGLKINNPVPQGVNYKQIPVPKQRAEKLALKGIPARKVMSPPRRERFANAESSAKARAAYAAMIKSRAEALKKRKQRPTGKPIPQAKDSLASIAARKQFIDRLKRQTATYNKLKTTKPSAKPVPKSLRNLADLLKKPIKTAAGNKGISPSVIKKMQDANKKMQASLFGGGKRPTSKRTFART